MAILKQALSTRNHDRDVMGMRYVYPVISRRAGGVSVGINLNPNNACNWHCAYCQVPNLTRGSAPDIDLHQLHDELTVMLTSICQGDFMQKHVPQGVRKLCDVAISGNGEPTSCQNFDEVVNVIVDVLKTFDLIAKIPLRLITNGSYACKPHVQRGLAMMANYRGEAWVKVDAATKGGIAKINGIHASAELLAIQVKAVASQCPTWIQTCMVAWDKEPPTEQDTQAYLVFLQEQTYLKGLQGVLLYGLARDPLQDESIHVSPLSEAWMIAFQHRIERVGLTVKLFI
ncbi:MAG: radical SAM protein [Mariprofundaceae bacterium]|nr:radical SAM protein [Mariprofundaceae bacterium]